MHWNGGLDDRADAAAVTGSDNLLAYEVHSIDVISPTNVWIVGDSGDNADLGGTPASTLIEHYNGTSWSIVPSPTAGTGPTP